MTGSGATRLLVVGERRIRLPRKRAAMRRCRCPFLRIAEITGSRAGKGTHSQLTDHAARELRHVLASSSRGYDKSGQDHRSMTHAQPVSMFSRGWMAGRAALLAVTILGVLAAPFGGPAQDAGVSGIPPGPGNALGHNGSTH